MIWSQRGESNADHEFTKLALCHLSYTGSLLVGRRDCTAAPPPRQVRRLRLCLTALPSAWRSVGELNTASDALQASTWPLGQRTKLFGVHARRWIRRCRALPATVPMICQPCHQVRIHFDAGNALTHRESPKRASPIAHPIGPSIRIRIRIRFPRSIISPFQTLERSARLERASSACSARQRHSPYTKTAHCIGIGITSPYSAGVTFMERAAES